MGDRSESDAFITGLDLDVVPVRERTKDKRLDEVRKKHSLLMEIVKNFGGKVGGMIDKQRYEFMTAYEQHIQDVQNELQNLREKVAEISGEETRKAKLIELDADQTRLKHTALKLDQLAVSQRKQLRKLVNELHSAENDRDWTFRKLETERKRYTDTLTLTDTLKTEMMEKTNTGSRANFSDSEPQNDVTMMQQHSADNVSIGGSVGGQSVFSNDSEVTIQVGQSIVHQSGSAAIKQFQNATNVNRDQALLMALPQILSDKVQKNPQQPMKTDADTSLYSMSGSYMTGQNTATGRLRTKAELSVEKEKRALGELVALKARQEELRDFVQQCASQCDKGPWARIPTKPVETVLAEARQLVQNYNPNIDRKRNELAFQLVAIPEVYFIISDMLSRSKEDETNDDMAPLDDTVQPPTGTVVIPEERDAEMDQIREVSTRERADEFFAHSLQTAPKANETLGEYLLPGQDDEATDDHHGIQVRAMHSAQSPLRNSSQPVEIPLLTKDLVNYLRQSKEDFAHQRMLAAEAEAEKNEERELELVYDDPAADLEEDEEQ
jgi:hypothetical protein